MTRHWQLWLAGLLLLCGSVVDWQAAEKHTKNEDVTDRRRLTPGLVLNTNARQGPCDVLGFVHNENGDGYSLMATGDDKVVRFWKVNGEIDVQSMKALRWPIFREQRGAIHAVALSPNGKQVVVGGMGVFNSYLAVIDRATGQIDHSIQKPPPGKALFAVTFSPDGKHVAYGGDDGSVWLWDLNVAAKDPVRQLLKGDSKRLTNRAYVVAFLDSTHVVAATQDGKVREADLTKGHEDGREIAHFKSTDLFRIGMSPDHRWLAAPIYDPQKQFGEVELIDLKENHHRPLRAKRDDYFPHCVTFDSDSRRLAVSWRQMQRPASFPTIKGGQVLLYDLQHQGEPAEGPEQHGGCAEAMAFHPMKKDLFASAGGPNHEVYLWDLRKPGKPISTVRGPGSSLWGVGFSADNRNLLAFQEHRQDNPKSLNDRGAGPWRVFDLRQRHFLSEVPSGFKTVVPLESVGDWHVEPDPKDGFRWFVRHGHNGDRWALEGPLYNKAISDIPRCYTFLKPHGKNPVRLAVGHYWGISVYNLDADDGPSLVRRMDGHEAEVMALAPSADGMNLVSASRDQTIAGWTLEGWVHQRELGASFKVNGHLAVDKVDLFSPAWEVGLAPDDRIQLLLLPNGEYYKEPGLHLDPVRPTIHDGTPIVKSALEKQVSLEAAHRYLLNPTPDRNIIFQWKTPDGRIKAAPTTVRQRPLWKFFPTRGGEWVIYRWRDYFYDCSTHGDEYYGWQENADPKAKDQTPLFYPLAHYSEKFHRPDKIADGLRAFETDPKKAFTEAFAEIEAPEVSLKVDNAKPNNVDVVVSITIKQHANDLGQQLDRVILWRDDYHVPFVAPANQVYNGFQVKISKEDLHRGLNHFKVVAYNKALGRGEATVAADFTPNPNRPQKGRMFSLCVGINKYNNIKGLQGDPLDACINDARALKGVLEKQNAMYHVDKPVLLLEDDATSGAILAEIDKAKKKALPDDLFVLSLAGHGFARPGKNNTEYDVKNWFFVCSNTIYKADDPASEKNTRVDSATLLTALSSMKCHKLVLLDACHSGSVVDPVRAITQNGFPLTIFAACRPHETAKEVGEHGIFTQSLVDAVEHGTKSNKSGRSILDARELADHLADDVPRRLKENFPKAQQNPVFFPEHPEATPLFRILNMSEGKEKTSRKTRP